MNHASRVSSMTPTVQPLCAIGVLNRNSLLPTGGSEGLVRRSSFVLARPAGSPPMSRGAGARDSWSDECGDRSPVPENGCARAGLAVADPQPAGDRITVASPHWCCRPEPKLTPDQVKSG